MRVSTKMAGDARCKARTACREWGDGSMKTENAKATVKRAAMTRRRFAVFAAGTATLALAPRRFARAQSGAVLKIGHIQPLTGPSAAYGIRARDGAIMALDEINAAGGWTDANGKKYTFEMPVGDMVNDPKQAITLFRQYATDPQVM